MSMRSSTPAAGEGTSTLTLSVSSSTTGSSCLTVSPSFFSQRAMVASVTDSPMAGTLIAMLIGDLSSLGQRQCIIEKALQLRLMLAGLAGCGRGRGLAAGVAQRTRQAQLFHQALDIRRDETPRALILRLFLAPDDLGVGEARQLVGERETCERIDLFQPQDLDAVLATLLTLLDEIVIDLSGAQDDALDLIVRFQRDRRAGLAFRIVPQHAVERRAGSELA